MNIKPHRILIAVIAAGLCLSGCDSNETEAEAQPSATVQQVSVSTPTATPTPDSCAALYKLANADIRKSVPPDYSVSLSQYACQNLNNQGGSELIVMAKSDFWGQKHAAFFIVGQSGPKAEIVGESLTADTLKVLPHSTKGWSDIQLTTTGSGSNGEPFIETYVYTEQGYSPSDLVNPPEPTTQTQTAGLSEAETRAYIKDVLSGWMGVIPKYRDKYQAAQAMINAEARLSNGKIVDIAAFAKLNKEFFPYSKSAEAAFREQLQAFKTQAISAEAEDMAAKYQKLMQDLVSSMWRVNYSISQLKILEAEEEVDGTDRLMQQVEKSLGEI